MMIYIFVQEIMSMDGTLFLLWNFFFFFMFGFSLFGLFVN